MEAEAEHFCRRVKEGGELLQQSRILTIILSERSRRPFQVDVCGTKGSKWRALVLGTRYDSIIGEENYGYGLDAVNLQTLCHIPQ